MTAAGNPPDALDLVQRWAAAEARNDADLLDGLLADDFVGVGPLGFVLTRDQWLVRFRNGLINRAFAVEEPQVHEHGGTAAIVVGVLAQETSFRGGRQLWPVLGHARRCAPGGPLAARQRPHRPAPEPTGTAITMMPVPVSMSVSGAAPGRGSALVCPPPGVPPGGCGRAG